MRFFDSTIAILLTQAIGLAAVFLVNLIISRVFGSEGKGAIALLMNTAEVLYAVANLALGTSAQYFVSKRLFEPRRLSGNFFFYPLLLLAGIVAVAALSWLLWPELIPGTILAIAVPALIVTIGMLFYEPVTQLLIAVRRLGLRSIAVFVMNGLLLVSAAGAALLAHDSINVLVWCYAGSFATTAATCLTLVTIATARPGRPSWSILRQTMNYGGWIYAANLVAHFAIRLDFFMVTAIAGIAAGGVYSVAMGLTSPLGILMGAIVGAFYPHTSGETDEQSLRTTPLVYRQVLMLLLAVSLVVGALSRPVLSLFGPDFVAGQSAMLLLLLAANFRGLSNILLSHLLGRGFPAIKTLSTVSSLVIVAVSCPLLVSSLGMVGGALSAAIAYFLETVLLHTLYVKKGGGSLAELFRFRWEDVTAILRESRRYLGEAQDHLRRRNP